MRLAFDKPLGMTSFQLVAKVRKSLTLAMGGRKIKVGHAGTLDPLATGVVVICTVLGNLKALPAALPLATRSSS